MENSKDKLANILWDFHRVSHALEKAEVIIGLGSYDISVAEYCSTLYQKGYASKIVFTGKEGNWTKGKINQTEAEIFAFVAEKSGVPKDALLLEKKATNISENIAYSIKILRETGFIPKKIIIVTKPNTTRRAYATALKLCPDIQILMSSADMKFSDFPTKVRTKDELTHEMVGDIQRLKIYGDRGWQVEQSIPQKVWNAFEALVSLGYTEHLLKF